MSLLLALGLLFAVFLASALIGVLVLLLGRIHGDSTQARTHRDG